jgi:hypothetical protein
MDAESIFELQNIDCNCNNCISFIRDIEKTKSRNNNEKIVAYKIHYGYCNKLKKEVAEVANICLLHTQKCFFNRRSEKFNKS